MGETLTNEVVNEITEVVAEDAITEMVTKPSGKDYALVGTVVVVAGVGIYTIGKKVLVPVAKKLTAKVKSLVGKKTDSEELDDEYEEDFEDEETSEEN